MANYIELFKQYIPELDKVYKNASLTANMDGASELARQGANADEMIIPKMSMDGQANYSRNGGYVNGDVTLTNETVKCNYDRGRMFTVDALDDIETASIAFGQLAGEYIRTKYVPEQDAFRFAKYAQEAGTKATGETLATGEAVIAAIRTATNQMDEDEVPTEGRILYITPTLKGLVDDLETIKSREVLSRFSQIVLVPQTRFYTKITLNDGTTAGQEAGGYVPAADAEKLNFLAIHPSAVIQYTKRNVNKVISPEANQTSDGWKFGFRSVGIAKVYENKVAGIYASSQSF
jgi:hypothetical protein